MSTRRTTSVAPHTTVPTEAEMRLALESYIAFHLAIESAQNTAKTAIETIKAEVAETTKPLIDQRASAQTTIMRYAEAHPELFEKRRKVEVYGGHKIGWQTGNPAVVLVRPPGAKRKQTWEGFLDACRRVGGWAMAFLRVLEQPDKDAVLAGARDGAVTDAQLAELGVAVAQEERFVIDLNLQPEAAATA